MSFKITIDKVKFTTYSVLLCPVTRESCGILIIQQTPQLLLLTGGEVVVFLFPRWWSGNWDIIQTNNTLSQASVTVHVQEVRVSIPLRLTLVIYSLSNIAKRLFGWKSWGYNKYTYIGRDTKGQKAQKWFEPHFSLWAEFNDVA